MVAKPLPEPPSPPVTTAAPVVLRPSPDADVDDNIVVLDGASWADFERILEIRGDNPVPRLAFGDGRLELMTPSRHHESIKSVIGCLIEAWCFERELDIHPFGSWTLKEAPREKGLEPDECYVVGASLEVGPEPERPDLAIEVVWTSGGIKKLPIYVALGVREVWIWRRGSITVHALRAAEYVPIPASEVLVGIDHAQLATFVDVYPMTRAARAYRAALAASADPAAAPSEERDEP